MEAPKKTTVRGRKGLGEVKKLKVRNHCFWLTVGLNAKRDVKDFTKLSGEEESEELAKSIEYVGNHLQDFLKFSSGGWDKDSILDSSVEFSTEIGEKRRQLHAHVLFQVKTNTDCKFLLDYEKLRTHFKAGAPWATSVYMLNKLVRGAHTGNFFQDYMQKQESY